MNDIIALKFHISLNATTWIGRVGMVLLPAIVYFVAYRWAVGLQRSDREVLEHGIETGIIKRLPHGAYVELHQPLGPRRRARPRDPAGVPGCGTAEADEQAGLEWRARFRQLPVRRSGLRERGARAGDAHRGATGSDRVEGAPGSHQRVQRLPPTAPPPTARPTVTTRNRTDRSPLIRLSHHGWDGSVVSPVLLSPRGGRAVHAGSTTGWPPSPPP